MTETSVVFSIGWSRFMLQSIKFMSLHMHVINSVLDHSISLNVYIFLLLLSIRGLGPRIMDVVGMDSNMFILSHGDGSYNYFHLYFMVKTEEDTPERKRKVRYIELKGRGGPETLETWSIVNKHTGISPSIYKNVQYIMQCCLHI